MAQLSGDRFFFGGAELPLVDARAQIVARYGRSSGREAVAMRDARGRFWRMISWRR
jgi:hypothetical protein